jgi:hypothetical protein
MLFDTVKIVHNNCSIDTELQQPRSAVTEIPCVEFGYDVASERTRIKRESVRECRFCWAVNN